MTMHIGTSGWHYRHWIGPFYPPKMRPEDFFGHYVRQLRTVEINATFYRLPSRAAVEAWRDGAPEGFVFAAKASRFITHMKKLRDPESSTGRFFDLVEVLGDRLGPIVFQLPPRWHIDLDRLAGFLQALPRQHRYAFEFRDRSWWLPETYRLLAKYGAAFCFHDLAGQQSPLEVTADFVYLRLHGPGGAYQGSYSDQALASWANRLLRWSGEGISAYCYFDNDERGYAPLNAVRLDGMLRGSPD